MVMVTLVMVTQPMIKVPMAPMVMAMALVVMAMAPVVMAMAPMVMLKTILKLKMKMMWKLYSHPLKLHDQRKLRFPAPLPKTQPLQRGHTIIIRKQDVPTMVSLL